MGISGMFPVTRRSDVIVRAEEFRFLLPQRASDLFYGPDIELPFLAFAVGVFRGKESAVRTLQGTDDVVEYASRRRFEFLPLGDRESIKINGADQGLVVEHLLKMRHQPLNIRAVSMN